ncbi:MAG: rhomboid family intramembrane serine protease, partial [Acidobacteriota bacterium]|nr:rhomboid family intramembrane serine protease [Acidobacteriota bacterium]
AYGEVLVAYGAKLNALINAGEWWRLIAPIFLHVSMPGAVIPFHLLVNMYGLWILGPYVERLYGSAKFVFFWIVTGIAGFVASYYSVQPEWQTNAVGRFLFKSDDVPTAGASGALFGLVGVLLVFGIKFRHELPEGFRKAFGFGLLPMVLINIFIGYLGRGFIDNAGHMGGFVAGILLALFIGYKRPGERGPVSIFWHAVQTALLLLVVASFVQVARHLGDARPNFENAAEQLFDSNATNAVAYINAINGGRQAFVAALNGKAGNTEQAIEALDRASHLDSKADQLRNDLKGLIVRARDFSAGAPKERNPKRRQQELNQIVADYSQWQQRSDEWVKTEGQNYGIIIQEQPQTPPNQQDGTAPPATNTKK